ncbi:sterol-binding protein, partial [Basidiobolus meristosporus CBS 931.73]
VNIPGFKSSVVFEQLKNSIESQDEAKKQATIKKTNGIYQFDIKNAEGKEQTWHMDLKKQGTVNTGKPSGKPDVHLTLSDDVFADLASGKLDATKAYMQGKLKFKGSMMLATKLDSVLKDAK